DATAASSTCSGHQIRNCGKKNEQRLLAGCSATCWKSCPSATKTDQSRPPGAIVIQTRRLLLLSLKQPPKTRVIDTTTSEAQTLPDTDLVGSKNRLASTRLQFVQPSDRMQSRIRN